MNIFDFEENCPGRLIPTREGVMAFVPDPLHVEIAYTPTIVKRLGAARSAVGRLEGALSGGKVAPLLISYPLMQREAVFSNRIEGTYTTPVDMALFDATSREEKEDGRQREQTKEVMNYIRAMNAGLWMIRSENLPICHRLILEAHRVLMDGVRGADRRPGEYREGQNYIGRESEGIANARFVPPPAPEMRRGMDELEHYVNTRIGGDAELDAFVGISLMHYQFETLHPFKDGNGRIGRLLIPLVFIERKILTEPLLHVSATLDRRKEEYRDRLLAVSRRGEWGPWLEFFLSVLEESADEALTKAQAFWDLYNDYQARVRTRRASGLLGRLVERLFQKPSLSINEAREVMGTSYSQAANHIKRLESLGILHEVTGQGRNKKFASREIFNLVFD